MPSWRQFYGGNYMSAKALGKRVIKSTITSVGPETIKGTDNEETTRLCLELKGEDKKFPVNAGNAEAIGAKFGDDYSKWKGKRIEVKCIDTKYNNERVKGLGMRPI